MGHYDVGLACLNGHEINSSADRSPECNAKFCPTCGEPTICQCEGCNAKIRGYYNIEGVFGCTEWKVASHCHDCGEPYPWTHRRTNALAEAIDELDELSEEERERLKKSIPDILAETPKSETAALRFRKVVAKLGSAGGKVLGDVLRKVAVDTVKSSLGL